VDAGISARRIRLRLEEAGVDPDDLDAVLISHEHTDHVAGLRVFLKRRAIPLFIAPESLAATSLDPGIFDVIEPLEAGRSFTLGDLEISPFPVPHDAAVTFGFVFRSEGVKTTLVTDLGQATNLVRERMRGSHCILLEFNHDVESLMESRYPLDVKMRIRGGYGHLSNGQAGSLLSQVIDGETRAVTLMHLSENNNHPALARLAAEEAVNDPGIAIEVARHREITPHWEG